MPYGTVKVDNVTFTNNSVDATTTFSGIYASITNNLTLSGTATAATFTGTTANFTNVNAQNIGVTTSLSGLAITGNTAGFTTVTGTTVTGTTANFVTVSGTTVTGTTARFISGIFTSLSGTTHTITSGVFASGTAALPSISFVSDPNTGIYSPGADQVAISTSGTGRVFVNSTGSMGIGATPGSVKLDVIETGTTSSIIRTKNDTTSVYLDANNAFAYLNTFTNHPLLFGTNNTERLRITAAGLVGLGTSGPSELLDIVGNFRSTNGFVRTAGSSANAVTTRGFRQTIDGVELLAIYHDNNGVVFNVNTSERARIDSSGRLLVGTSTSQGTGGTLQVGGSSVAGAAPTAELNAFGFDGRLRLTRATIGSPITIVASGNRIGRLVFDGYDGAAYQEAALIAGEVDGTPGTNDMPGRLVFSTTADGASSPTERMRIDSAGTTTLTSAAATAPFIAKISSSEVARIDSSGRLLLNLSSDINIRGIGHRLQIAGSSFTNASQALLRHSNDANPPGIEFAKTRGTTASSVTIVSNGDSLGQLLFSGADGSAYVQAASIKVEVDGTPGTNDMPGRLVLSTTEDGSSGFTEALRITNDRVIAYNQPTPTSKSAAATLTIAELKTGIIQYTGAVATLTLPTGTLMEGGFSGIYTNMAFEWSVINTGAGICTVAAGTDHTVIGSGTVAIGASARFVSRRTAANTFVSYCLS